jgi:hypothetical protein
MIEKAATGAAIGTCGEIYLEYQPAAENNEATVPQIAAQTPSDRSTATIKYARVSGR